jgi:hypothetical protein
MTQVRRPSTPSDESPKPIGVPVPRTDREPSHQEIVLVRQCAAQLGLLRGDHLSGMSRLREIANQLLD